MYIEGEPIIATAYIGRKGDEKNRCFLSKESIFVKYRSQLKAFDLASVKTISFKHKTLLFPIVVGGIVAPLSVLGLLKTTTNPWMLLSVLVIGLLMIYYGYEGSSTLTIDTSVKEFDFFISKPTPNLEAFAKYARQITAFGVPGSLFYFSLSSKEWAEAIHQGTFKISNNLPLLYYEDVLKGHSPFFAIDPLQCPHNVDFNLKDNTIQPELKGTVNTEDIINPDS